MNPTPPAIDVRLTGTLGQFALDVAFTVPMRGVTALVGPSGCGKTTVLRCIAGLERLTGHVGVGDEIWQDSARGVFLPPHRRRVGYVFQEASLFQHLSVRDNLLYAAHRRGTTSPGQRPVDVDGIVSLLGLGGLLPRGVTALSGGERQRVAVGRALLSDPGVLLMDEPLSALDAASKDDILPYFEMLHERLQLPILYISHDLSEVERLADTLVLMAEGRVTATGRLTDMQTDNRLPLLAAPGATVVLDGLVAGFDDAYQLTDVTVAGGRLIVAGRHGAIGDRRRLRIAATDVSLALTAATDTTIVNCLPARIVSIDRDAASAQASVVVGLGANGDGVRIAARITRKSLDALGLAPGAAVFAQIKGVAVIASGGVSAR